MKLLNKITMIMFSVLMLIISIIFCLLGLGWLKITLILAFISAIFTNQFSLITLSVIAVISIVLAVRAIFFDIDEDTNTKKGILLENSDGKLLIAKDTLEKLVNNVARDFEKTESVTSRITVDEETNNLIVDILLTVKKDTIIKELSANIQQKVKRAIKDSSDLDVKNVNIMVRNISNGKEV